MGIPQGDVTVNLTCALLNQLQRPVPRRENAAWIADFGV